MNNRHALPSLGVLGFIGLLDLTGCGIDYPDGTYACGTKGRECPPGLYCHQIDQRCHYRKPESADVAGSTDAVTGGAGKNTAGTVQTDAVPTVATGGSGGVGGSNESGGKGGTAGRGSGGAKQAGSGRGAVSGGGTGGTGGTVGTAITCGNETCKDPVTGLEWQRCPAGLSGSDCASDSAALYSWQQASEYCNALPLTGGGWRLPSIYELVSIVDFSKSNPSVDPALFPATPTGDFWSSSSDANPLGTNAWCVRFLSGNVFSNIKAFLFYARCVRGEPMKVGLFDVTFDVNSGDPLAQDAATSLIWQGCPSGQSGNGCSGAAITYNWQEANDYCATLNFAGYATGWRLPKIRELISIVDYSKYSPAINPDGFSSASLGSFWSSSPIAAFDGDAWFVNFATGDTTFQSTMYIPFQGRVFPFPIDLGLMTIAYNARCVRDKP